MVVRYTVATSTRQPVNMGLAQARPNYVYYLGHHLAGTNALLVTFALQCTLHRLDTCIVTSLIGWICNKALFQLYHCKKASSESGNILRALLRSHWEVCVVVCEWSHLVYLHHQGHPTGVHKEEIDIHRSECFIWSHLGDVVGFLPGSPFRPNEESKQNVNTQVEGHKRV